MGIEEHTYRSRWHAANPERSVHANTSFTALIVICLLYVETCLAAIVREGEARMTPHEASNQDSGSENAARRHFALSILNGIVLQQ